ncbi:MAG: hypothetical protein ACKOAH_10615, partial [Pirellula sp.]
GSLGADDHLLRSTCPPPATWGFQMDSGQRGSRSLLSFAFRILGIFRINAPVPGGLEQSARR